MVFCIRISNCTAVALLNMLYLTGILDAASNKFSYTHPFKAGYSNIIGLVAELLSFLKKHKHSSF